MTKKEVIQTEIIRALRERLRESQETIQAIRSGAVDAIVVSGDDGEKVFSLQGAETPYRAIIETMNEGALVVDAECTVTYCNTRFAKMVGRPMEQLMGASLLDIVTEPGTATVTRRELLEQFEHGLKKGREVLQKTSDDRLLNTNWRMLIAGKVVSDQPCYVAIRDGVLNHMAHHRGQLTVYLRLNDERVPAIYGPSADEGKG